MATYILKAANHDTCGGGADFNREVSTGTEGAGSISPSIAASGTEDSFVQTPSGVPNSDASWNTGNHTVEVNVTGSSMNVDLQIAVARVDSACNVEETGSFTGVQTLHPAGVYTFIVTPPTWGTGGDAIACGDMIRYIYRFINNDTMMAQSVTIETGTTDTEHTSPITENDGTCFTATQPGWHGTHGGWW